MFMLSCFLFTALTPGRLVPTVHCRQDRIAPTNFPVLVMKIDRIFEIPGNGSPAETTFSGLSNGSISSSIMFANFSVSVFKCALTLLVDPAPCL